jgi:hypothetical protein
MRDQDMKSSCAHNLLSVTISLSYRNSGIMAFLVDEVRRDLPQAGRILA